MQTAEPLEDGSSKDALRRVEHKDALPGVDVGPMQKHGQRVLPHVAARRRPGRSFVS